MKKLVLLCCTGFFLVITSINCSFYNKFCIKNNTDKELKVCIYTYYMGAYRGVEPAHELILSPHSKRTLRDERRSSYALFTTRGILLKIYEHNQLTATLKTPLGPPPLQFSLAGGKNWTMTIDNTLFTQRKVDDEITRPCFRGEGEKDPNLKYEIPFILKEFNDWGINAIDLLDNDSDNWYTKREHTKGVIISAIDKYLPINFDYNYNAWEDNIPKEERAKRISDLLSWWRENRDCLYWSEKKDSYLIDQEAKKAGISTEEYRKTHPWPKENEPDKPDEQNSK